jgi:serine/threonine-protein kinase RsbW
MATYRRLYEGQKEQVATIRDFVKEAATALGASGSDLSACELVVDEAATNAFTHAYAGQPGRVEIELWREDDSMVLRVRDWGAGFDPEAVPEPDVRRPLEERPLGGLGLLLIRKFSDQVFFAFEPQAGNSITVRRRLHPSDPRRVCEAKPHFDQPSAGEGSAGESTAERKLS